MYVVGPSIIVFNQYGIGMCGGALYLLDCVESNSLRNFVIAVLLSVVAVLTRQLCLWLVPLLGAYASKLPVGFAVSNHCGRGFRYTIDLRCTTVLAMARLHQ